jgi:hypothetical protein
MGIRNLTKENAYRRHNLLKSQRTTDKQAGKTQLREHHAVEKANENNGQCSNTGLKQTQAQQAWKRERQLESFS